MYFRISARELITRIASIIIASGVVGYLFGHTFLVVSIVSIGLLVWHYNHLFKLINWLWQGKSISPPQAKGVWGRIYDGLYRRIRKQRLKQKQLNERIRKFRDGAEALPDAALVLSSDLTILWGNKKASQLLGVRWPSDVGQRIDNLIRFPEFSKYVNSGNYDSPCLVISPVNNDLQLELRMMAYGSDQVLLLARDISKIQRLEQMRRDFVANVSHELKTPLTVVRGYVENDDHLPVDLSRLILTIVEDVQWLNQDKNHTINDYIAPDIKVRGNEHELKSACMNLISNAIAYTPANGVIDVTLRNDGHKIRFSVKDNGPGIKPEHVNRLTERFFRVDMSRSRNTGGSGLGLAIVKHVLNHHNAELAIESELNKGSEFIICFTLPIAD